ncbi:MAG: hypothetical protein CME71_06035 [Halobacteriovorax sp.]|nr:hypothetical protein [Halobacteriovorax sp.]|tara:strand:+ start:18 stop:572 length:555 start_codon:yes stop_codon:yes gene_type:complete
MRLLLTILFIFPLTSHACLELDQKSIALQWTGYKTAAKLGVSGTFEEVTYKGKTKAKDLAELLVGAQLDMNITTPKSGDASRDSNLKNSFFKLIGKNATAKVTKFERGLARVDVKLGSKTVEVALSPDLSADKLVMTGTLDMYDFAIDKAYKSISTVCRALHEGKTWNDVAVKVTANVTPCKAQ